jgi:hypothetical protein
MVLDLLWEHWHLLTGEKLNTGQGSHNDSVQKD